MPNITQPLVFRLHFNNEEEVLAVQSELRKMDVYSDYVKVRGEAQSKFRMIFLSEDLNYGLGVLNGLTVKPVKTDYFDPQAPWSEEFKTV